MENKGVAVKFLSAKIEALIDAMRKPYLYQKPASSRLLSLWLCLFVGWFFAVQLPPAHGAPLAQSISASKQFRVYGESSWLRGLACSRLDQIREEFLRFGGFPKEEGSPIVVRLLGSESTKRTTKVTRSYVRRIDGGGLHLQLDVPASSASFENEESLYHEVVSLLLYQKSSFQSKGAEKADALPLWLRRGVAAAMLYKKSGRWSHDFALLVKKGVMPPLSELLLMNEALYAEAHSLRREVHDLGATTLCMALLSQPRGKASFQKVLKALPLPSDELRELLGDSFPAMGRDPSALEKWWALQMAMIAEPSVTELMSIQESEEAFREVLAFLPEIDESMFLGTTKKEKSTKLEKAAEKTEKGVEKEKKGFVTPLTPIFALRKFLPSKKNRLIQSPREKSEGREKDKVELSEQSGFSKKLQQAEVSNRQWMVAGDSLKALQPKIHPLSRSILSSYLHLLTRMHNSQAADEGRGDFVKDWASLAKQRAELFDRAEQVSQVMEEQEQSARQNYAPRKVLPTRGGGMAPRARQDAISQYLDSLEREYR